MTVDGENESPKVLPMVTCNNCTNRRNTVPERLPAKPRERRIVSPPERERRTEAAIDTPGARVGGHDNQDGHDHDPEVATPDANDTPDTMPIPDATKLPAKPKVVKPKAEKPKAEKPKVVKPKVVKPKEEPAPRRGVREPKVEARRGANPAKARGDGSPIWNSFYSNFKKCEPGCEPAGYGTFGRRGNPSCHHGGRALDLPRMKCNDGKTYEAIAHSSRFQKMVQCMGNRGMKTIYWQNKRGKNDTQNHKDHAHFSNWCTDQGKRVY